MKTEKNSSSKMELFFFRSIAVNELFLGIIAEKSNK
jgi:hypothetical protein